MESVRAWGGRDGEGEAEEEGEGEGGKYLDCVREKVIETKNAREKREGKSERVRTGEKQREREREKERERRQEECACIFVRV